MTVFYRKRTTPKIDKKWQILSKKGVFTWTLSIFKEKKEDFAYILAGVSSEKLKHFLLR